MGDKAYRRLTVRRRREAAHAGSIGGRVLDGFYVPTRYPNGHPDGPPSEHYGPLHSTQAIDHANQTLAFVRHRLA